MKRILLAFSAAALFSASVLAQDANKIEVSAYVAPNSGVPPAAEKVLESKLTNLITASGFGAAANERFILTAHVTILTEDVTPTTPPLFSYTLSYNLYLGDGMTGTLYSSAQIEAKGVGQTKDKAYLQALKSLSPRDPQLKRMVEEGKQKIIDYFNTNGAAILARAASLANNQQYDAAMWELNSIPSCCPELYAKAQAQMMQVFSKEIAQDGQEKLAQAQAIWNSAQDRDAADRAGAILASINPDSPAYAQAQKLHNQISATIKAKDDREWNFRLQQQRDATAVQQSQIKAARDVAVAYAQNQPKTVYKIYWW